MIEVVVKYFLFLLAEVIGDVANDFQVVLITLYIAL